jgi:hypothetical protein
VCDPHSNSGGNEDDPDGKKIPRYLSPADGIWRSRNAENLLIQRTQPVR